MGNRRRIGKQLPIPAFLSKPPQAYLKTAYGLACEKPYHSERHTKTEHFQPQDQQSYTIQEGDNLHNLSYSVGTARLTYDSLSHIQGGEVHIVDHGLAPNLDKGI